MERETSGAIIIIWVLSNDEELQKTLHINSDKNAFSHRSEYYLYTVIVFMLSSEKVLAGNTTETTIFGIT